MKKNKDLIQLENGMWADKLNILARLRSMGLEPPRKRKWWKFWK